MNERSLSYRKDIDGLRAIAVLTVVAFHMRAPMAQAGFIGVDIFFVLSGFLITGILLNEHRSQGTIRFGRFWTRRIRRLLPAATLTTIGTLVLTYLFLPVTAWDEVARTAVATVLYYANFLFAADASDYFAANIQENPLLHFWSLAVEEQFYLVWPIVVWASAGLVRRLSKPMWTVAVPIGAVTLASFGYSLWLTAQETPWAYYSSPSRAWEFGVGGLVAILSRHRTVSTHLQRYGSWAGLAIIGVGLLLISEATPFPGLAALFPVVGTALCCYCIPAPTSLIHKLLTLRPALWFGKISYSLYLWHWPLLVIGQRAINTSVAVRVAMVAVSMVLAAASHAFLEDPVRHLAALKRSVRLNFALGVALIAAGLFSSLALDRALADRLEDPFVADVSAAAQDFIEPVGCATNNATELRENCSYGDPDGEQTILLLGDSHAAQWIPAFDEIGRSANAQVVVRFSALCPAALVTSDLRPIAATECAELQRTTGELLIDLDPDVVVIAHIARYLGDDTLETTGGASQDQAWADGVTDLLDLIDTTSGAEVLWFYDQPLLKESPIDCLADTNEANADSCNPTQGSVTRLQRRVAAVEEPIIDGRANVIGIDSIGFLCDGTTCDLFEDGTVRYRDQNHFTGAFVLALVEEIEPAVQALLAK